MIIQTANDSSGPSDEEQDIVRVRCELTKKRRQVDALGFPGGMRELSARNFGYIEFSRHGTKGWSSVFNLCCDHKEIKR